MLIVHLPRRPTFDFAACVRSAMAETGTSEKALAIDMGIGLPQLSRQLSGLEHLSVQRLACCPEEFQAAVSRRWAEAVGLVCQRHDDAAEAILGAVRALLSLRPKPIAVTLPEYDELPVRKRA